MIRGVSSVSMHVLYRFSLYRLIWFKLFSGLVFHIFRFVFPSSGGFRPPPATLAMVAGGGGRKWDIKGLLDQL